MKIYVNQIPPEGICLTEEIPAQALELDAQLVRLKAPLRVEAEISRGLNCLSGRLVLHGLLQTVCSRCLSELEISFDKEVALNLPVDKRENFIDITPQLREEVILDYPLKPLCRPDCLGLCPGCGQDLNKNKCVCKNKKE